MTRPEKDYSQTHKYTHLSGEMCQNPNKDLFPIPTYIFVRRSYFNCAHYNNLHPQGTWQKCGDPSSKQWLTFPLCRRVCLTCSESALTAAVPCLQQQGNSRLWKDKLGLKAEKRNELELENTGTSPVQTYWHLPQQWNIQQANCGNGRCHLNNPRSQ